MSFDAGVLLGLLEGHSVASIAQIGTWTGWQVDYISVRAKELQDMGFAAMSEDGYLTLKPKGVAAIKALKDRGLDSI